MQLSLYYAMISPFSYVSFNSIIALYVNKMFAILYVGSTKDFESL